MASYVQPTSRSLEHSSLLTGIQIGIQAEFVETSNEKYQSQQLRTELYDERIQRMLLNGLSWLLSYMDDPSPRVYREISARDGNVGIAQSLRIYLDDDRERLNATPMRGGLDDGSVRQDWEAMKQCRGSIYPLPGQGWYWGYLFWDKERLESLGKGWSMPVEETGWVEKMGPKEATAT